MNISTRSCLGKDEKKNYPSPSTTTYGSTDDELRDPSEPIYNPEYHSSLRNLSVENAIYNLIGTIVGGGVLSLPDAFSRAGIIPSTIMMIFSAVLSDFCMFVLCCCSRWTGQQTYGEVTRIAFGRKAEFITSILLFFFLCLVIIGYMILIKDTFSPILLQLVPSWRHWTEEKEQQDAASDYFLILFLLLILPLNLKTDLHSLRHSNYASFIALLILVVAIAYQAYMKHISAAMITPNSLQKDINWFSTDLSDWIFAFPIIGLSFFSIYNVLPVQARLIDPTSERIVFVFDASIGICFVLFYIVAIAGYFYAYDETKDNILLNFPVHFDLITIGRFCFGVTLMFGLPLIMLPCKDTLFNLPLLYRHLLYSNRAMTTTEERLKLTDGSERDDFEPLSSWTDSTLDTSSTTTDKDALSSYNTLVTVGILVSLYIVSTTLPGVGIVWAFSGSSMSLLFGFFIPCACYLKLRSRKEMDLRSITAFLITAFSVIASFVCTQQILSNATMFENK